MQVIWKFPILMNRASLPRGAEVVAAGVQEDQFFLWALVDPEEPASLRGVYVYATGQSIPEDRLGDRYIQTIFEGSFVWHVFEEVTA